MADRLNEAVAHVAARFRECFSRTVSVTRDGVTITGVTAVVGQKAFRTTGPGGRSIIVRSDRDFLIAPSALDFGSGAVEPCRGMRITDDGQVYEVYSPIGNEEPAFRLVDDDTMYRIHTRRVT